MERPLVELLIVQDVPQDGHHIFHVAVGVKNGEAGHQAGLQRSVAQPVLLEGGEFPLTLHDPVKDADIDIFTLIEIMYVHGQILLAGDAPDLDHRAVDIDEVAVLIVDTDRVIQRVEHCEI